MTRSTQRRGIAAPAVAVCLIVLLAILALAVDGGQLMGDRRNVQAAADAAALAAAADLYQQMVANWPNNPGRDGTGGTAKKSAYTTALENGYKKSHVTVNVAPEKYNEGASAGQQLPNGYTEVIVVGKQKRAFSSIFGGGNLSIHSRAVSRARFKMYTPTGILVLDPTSSGSLTLNGSASVILNGNSAVVVDSSSASAATVTGTGTVTANTINITGGSALKGSGSLNGTVNYRTPPEADPLATLPVPDPTTMPARSYSGGSGTLNPGYYAKGISAGSQDSVVLNPGIYYLDGGLSVGAHASLTGHGVMIYNNSGAISMTGDGTVDLSPPIYGLYTGLSFFQNRTNASDITLTGGSNMTFAGTFYAARGSLKVTGSGDFTLGSQLIVYTMKVGGNGNVLVDYAGGQFIRIREICLVE
jgi:hypothetical protein